MKLIYYEYLEINSFSHGFKDKLLIIVLLNSYIYFLFYMKTFKEYNVLI